MAEPILKRFGGDEGSTSFLGDRYDLGLLPQQQTPQDRLARKMAEVRQMLLDSLGPAPRNTGGGGTTSGQAVLRGAANRYLSNVANIPNLLLPGNFSSPPGAVIGETPPMYTPFRSPISGNDLMAGIDAAGEFAGALRTGDFGQFSPDMGEASRFRSEVMAQERPMETFIGKGLGDVATLFGLRSPFAKARSEQELAFKRGNIAHEAEKEAVKVALAQNPKQALDALGVEFAETATSAIDSVAKGSRAMRWMMNRGARAGEAGLEGAVLATLTENDPAEMFGYSAGTQAAGSVMTSLLGAVVNNPGKAGIALLVAAANAGSIMQALKTVVPGGNNFSLESFESGYEKVMAGLGVGMLAGMAGAGRMTGKFPVKLLPQVADAFSSIPRAGMISVINAMSNDTRAERVVKALSADPNYFGPTAARRLERAFRNPNISISGVIDDLMENKDFRTKFEALEKSQ